MSKSTIAVPVSVPRFMRAAPWSVLVVALALAPTPGLAADSGQSKTVSGLTLFLGVVPAEVIRGHPKAHPERQAHGGPPSGAHAYHLVVAIFDAESGARVEDAKAWARVSSLGLAGPHRRLEPMRIADTTTYGNYFDLPGKGPYRIVVDVERPEGTVSVEFAYDH